MINNMQEEIKEVEGLDPQYTELATQEAKQDEAKKAIIRDKLDQSFNDYISQSFRDYLAQREADEINQDQRRLDHDSY